MKWRRASAVLSAVLLTGLVFSANLKDRVLANAQAPAKSASPSNPSTVGQWGAPIQLGMVPIHAALFQNSQVLFWQYGTGITPGTVAVMFNPVTQTVTSIPTEPTDDFFCSGTTHLSDGRLLLDGGLTGPTGHGPYGTSYAAIFDPTTNAFSSLASMQYARYYPTNIAMPDGTQLVVSGEDATGVITPELESWSSTTNSWTTLPATANLPNGAQPWQNYPRMFLLPSSSKGGIIPAGSLYIANQLYHTWFFNPAHLTSPWTFIEDYNNPYRYRAAQVLMPDANGDGSLDTVMVMGGQASDVALPTNTTETVNLSSGTPVWTYGPPMATARHDLNAVQLPDGTILVVGGASGAGKYSNPVKAAALYTPSTKAWTTLASQLGSRGYHSTALLLPNGTVLSAGSDSGDQYQTYAEIYSPPYLFKGQRPVITSIPATIDYGTTFTVATPAPAAIGSVALIRLDALTHADHMDQRMLNLSFTGGHGGLQVTAPANANYAPPGYYMVFIVTTAGVPSVAKIVQVASATARAAKVEAVKPYKQ
jgi:hypothetical protein